MIHAKTGDKTQKTKKKHRWIFFLLLLILFILAGVGYWFFGRPADDFYFDKQARDGLIKARTKEDVQKILDTVVEKGMFNASINPNPVFPNGKTEGDLYIENIKANHYYTKVGITLTDGGETVFQSGGIKPDQNIEKAKLDKELPKGTYPAVARFSIIDPQTLKDIGVVNINITLTIQN